MSHVSKELIIKNRSLPRLLTWNLQTNFSSNCFDVLTIGNGKGPPKSQKNFTMSLNFFRDEFYAGFMSYLESLQALC